MTDVEIRTPEEIEAAGLSALQRELGPVDSIRFLRMLIRNDRDYTESRRERVDSLTAEDIQRMVEELRAAGKLTRQRLGRGTTNGNSEHKSSDV